MEYNFRTAKITASSDDNKWGGCFAENGLWILLEVATEDDTPASHVGKTILDLLLVRFSTTKVRGESLVNELLSEVQNNKAVTTLLIGSLFENVLFLGCTGQGTVMIKRQQKLGRLLTGSATAKGKVAPGDVFIFHSDKFDSLVDMEKKARIFSGENLEDMEEEIASHILGNSDALGGAVLAFTITSVKENETLLNNNKGLSGVKKLAGQRGELFTNKIKEFLNYIINRRQSKNRKKFITVSTILVLLLIFSIINNLRNSQTKTRRQQLTEVMEMVSQQYDEGVSLIDLNPIRARELLSSSKLSLAKLLKETKKNSPEYKSINEWLGKVSSAEVSAYKIYKLTAVPLFFDINLVKPGGEGASIASYKQLKVILDTKNKTLYLLSTDTKKAAVLAGENLVKDAKTVALHGDIAYILNSEGIFGIDIKSKTAKEAVKKDEQWGNITHLAAFGGNLYLLDKTNNSIWKYIATDFGFSSIKSYINPGVNINFSHAGKMSIDGSIWVPDGQIIYKFTDGQPEQFVLRGFSETVGNIDDFYTSDSENNFYILDKSLARIIVFDKDGYYQSQYQWEDLKTASDIVVTEDEDKIFILSGSKIYAIDIK